MKRLFTLLSFVFTTVPLLAQIPNAGFETWTTVGSYNNPTGWDSPNATTASLGAITCDSGMNAPPQGLAYLKLVSDTIAFPLPATVPGVAVTGTIVISGTSYSVSGGFVNTTRPANLTGKWQHMAKIGSSDHARVGVYLWKWNTALNRRDTVALQDSILTGMAMSWESFTIPITYFSGVAPDSALIILSSSATSTSVADSSYLYVDDLAFTGLVPAGVISLPLPDLATTVYPNPAKGSVAIYYHSDFGKEITIELADIAGHVIRKITPKAFSGENSISIDLKGIAQGIYFVRVIDDNGVKQSKLYIE